MKMKVLYTLFSIIFLVACHRDQKEKKDETILVFDPGICDDCGNFVSPIEIPALLQEVGSSYSSKYLFQKTQVGKIYSEFGRTFLIGLLVTDLGYLNIYSKSEEISNLLPILQRLSDDVRVGHLIDYSTLRRLAASNSNPDSLMYLSVNTFRTIDEYWREGNKSDLSTLLLSGVWLESLYLATRVIKQKENERIKERIGEQQVKLQDLLKMMERYKSNQYFQDLIAAFKKIEKAYEGGELSYQFGEPVHGGTRKKAAEKENAVRAVQMTPKQLDAIIKATEEIRNKWVED